MVDGKLPRAIAARSVFVLDFVWSDVAFVDVVLFEDFGGGFEVVFVAIKTPSTLGVNAQSKTVMAAFGDFLAEIAFLHGNRGH